MIGGSFSALYIGLHYYRPVSLCACLNCYGLSLIKLFVHPTNERFSLSMPVYGLLPVYDVVEDCIAVDRHNV